MAKYQVSDYDRPAFGTNGRSPDGRAAAAGDRPPGKRDAVFSDFYRRYRGRDRHRRFDAMDRPHAGYRAPARPAHNAVHNGSQRYVGDSLRPAGKV